MHRTKVRLTFKVSFSEPMMNSSNFADISPVAETDPVEVLGFGPKLCCFLCTWNVSFEHIFVLALAFWIGCSRYSTLPVCDIFITLKEPGVDPISSSWRGTPVCAGEIIGTGVGCLVVWGIIVLDITCADPPTTFYKENDSRRITKWISCGT